MVTTATWRRDPHSEPIAGPAALDCEPADRRSLRATDSAQPARSREPLRPVPFGDVVHYPGRSVLAYEPEQRSLVATEDEQDTGRLRSGRPWPFIGDDPQGQPPEELDYAPGFAQALIP